MNEKKEEESMKEKNKSKTLVILSVILVVAVFSVAILWQVFVVFPAMTRVYSDLCGTWEHNYIWSVDNESYRIELAFYDDKTFRMSDTNDLFGVECGRWYVTIPRDGLWNTYENAVAINFHSWVSFYTPHDTDIQAGIVTCKVGCEWVTMRECFLMIFPSGDKYEFINIDVQ